MGSPTDAPMATVKQNLFCS
jgi:hypothetical protein